MRFAGLIPALDAATTVGDVVAGAREHLERVLVVDDGSSDRTAAVAKTAGAGVLRHEQNLGKGAAILAGLRRLRDEGFSHAVTLDADGQHLPAEIPKLTAESRVHPGAIVVGAREIESEVAALNLFANAFANLWVRIAAGKDLGDTQSGFRVYPIAATLDLRPAGLRFELETEVLIRAARAGLDVRPVGVRVFYPPPDERKSHYDPWWDTLRVIRVVVGLWLRVY
jgi:glycosyltransferase involved in cell wall biosynthesis